MKLSRTEKILNSISKPGKILELGPSYSPVISREEGWDYYSIDHATAAELKAKYNTADNVDITRIQEVDFVWKNGELHSAVPSEHLLTFDACIASHVIEHTPDLVGFFESISQIIRLDGVISLVVPDKRFCFDYFQSISMTGEVLEAYQQQRTRHSKKSIYNAGAYACSMNKSIAWGQVPTQSITFNNESLEEAWSAFSRHANEGCSEYVDVHAWYFTPSSFRLICYELRQLGLIPFEEINFFETAGCEFFVSLKKTAAKPSRDTSERRKWLLTQILLETRQQTDYLIEGSVYIGKSSNFI